MIVCLPVLLWLGNWQIDRAAEKRALVDAYTAAGTTLPTPYAAELARFTRVVAQGRWVGTQQFLLDAAIHDGQVGFRVLTPLALDDGRWLIVDRGWVAGDPARRALPEVTLAADPAVVSGLIDSLPRAGIAMGADSAPVGAPWPRIVLYPTVEALAAALSHPLEPRVLRLDPGAAAGYERVFAPDFGVSRARHLGYAATWFLLALTMVGLWARATLGRRDGR